MARLTPEQLEQKIHAVLREQPLRPAPRSLEARVRGEIARRQALPWWHRSYACWPQPIKLTFLVVATGLAAAMLLLFMPVLGVVSGDALRQIFQPISGVVHTLRAASSALLGLVTPTVPEISSTYLYGGLAIISGAYAVMLGLGATAYRVLWQHR